MKYMGGKPPLQWKLKLLAGNHSLQSDGLPGKCLVVPPLVAIITLQKIKIFACNLFLLFLFRETVSQI